MRVRYIIQIICNSPFSDTDLSIEKLIIVKTITTLYINAWVKIQGTNSKFILSHLHTHKTLGIKVNVLCDQ
mgnify:CR=1 FL=1